MIMDIINSIFNKMFNILFYPFHWLNPVWGLIFISVVVGIMMLFIFKHTSNQAGIKQLKNELKAHLLEFRLYKDDVALSLEAMKDLFQTNFGYIKFALKPMLILMVPTILILIQLATWYEFRPLQVGEKSILSIKVKNAAVLDRVEIQTPEGLQIETPPIRIAPLSEIDWRLKATRVGDWQIRLIVDGKEYSKTVRVGSRFVKLAPYRLAGNSLSGLLYPVEKSLPGDGALSEIHIRYPHRETRVWGMPIHWLVIFLVVSIAAGFSMKGVFKVEI